MQVLGDPAARRAYDDLARDVRYHSYVPGVTQRAAGGEDLLLAELERLGLRCEPGTQLVVCCGVCGRPATKECYACTMPFCEFCTRKPHWRGRFGLHYPVHNVPGHASQSVAKRELEKKRLDDAKRLQLEDPNFRNASELREARERPAPSPPSPSR